MNENSPASKFRNSTKRTMAVSTLLLAYLSSMGCVNVETNRADLPSKNRQGTTTTDKSSTGHETRSRLSDVPLGFTASTFASSDDTSCVAVSDGSLVCWGCPRSKSKCLSPTAWVKLETENGKNTIKSISLGAEHGCAMFSDGSISCFSWGATWKGQLGCGRIAAYGKCEVAGDERAVGISAAHDTTCTWDSDGNARCWGWNENKQLGENCTRMYSDVPVEINGIAGAKSISVGGGYVCAIVGDLGEVMCWGSNSCGQLGIAGNLKASARPMLIKGITNAVAISAGTEHSCVILENEKVLCWGNRSCGQLGDGSADEKCLEGGCSPVVSPVELRGIAGAAKVTTGQDHTCILSNDQTITCWGGDTWGQIGESEKCYEIRSQNFAAWEKKMPFSGPVKVEGLVGAVDVSAGMRHTCSILASGNVSCWGYGYANCPIDNTEAMLAGLNSIHVQITGLRKR